MLLEQPGPWGSDALTESRLDPALGLELASRAKALKLKLLLITRPDRHEATDRTAFLVRADAGWIEQRTLADPRELLDAPLEALAAGHAPTGWGSSRTAPLYLVCTNGRRDACCALFGRPLAAALSRVSPHVWESSHLGGHRFAGNLVCLPEALLYGRVTPSTGVGLLAAHAAGRLAVRALRGRAAWPVAAQAAEIALRRRLGVDGIADVTLASVTSATDIHDVELGVRGERWRLRLRAAAADPPRRTSCLGDKLERPLTWELLTIERG